MSLFATYPSVYVVAGEYQICTLVSSECVMWVEVSGKKFFDHSNGILRSGRFVHIAKIPQVALDSAREYKVCLRKINERKPYFTDFGDVEEREYAFHPLVEKNEYRIVNLADAHSLVKAPVTSGGYFGDSLDLLILNGDIPNHSGDINCFKNIYEISGAITKGAVPCVFSRGNHDMRGIYGEQLADYTPTCNGKSYFTFRLGPIWGVVLDTGEDKADNNEAYGNTICCEAFREEEEAFLDSVIAGNEYADASIRLIVCHNPFAFALNAPFSIEAERYARWCRKLEAVKPTVMLTGHLHMCFIEDRGGEHDVYGCPCKLICSSKVNRECGSHTSGAITISKCGDISVDFITAEAPETVLS